MYFETALPLSKHPAPASTTALNSSRDYYNLLAERECRHIRETVTVTGHVGHMKTTINKSKKTVEFVEESATKARDKQNAAEHSIIGRLQQCVKINRHTKHATYIDYLVKYIDEIINGPRSYKELAVALFDITETATKPDYPKKDRAFVCAQLSRLLKNVNLDNCFRNEIQCSIHKMNKI